MQKRQVRKIPEHIWAEIAEKYKNGVSRMVLLQEYSQWGLKEPTMYSRMKKMGIEKGRNGYIKTYTSPTSISVGEQVVVVDGADPKTNGKIITVTKVGSIFIEGVDENKKPVAAYKVKKAPQVSMENVSNSPSQAEEEVGVEGNNVATDTSATLPTRPAATPNPDDIVWERKLVFDIQTLNHMYRVKVESKKIDIIDGDAHEISIPRDRMGDVYTILKNLPKMLEEA